jgi:hypothetical protein
MKKYQKAINTRIRRVYSTIPSSQQKFLNEFEESHSQKSLHMNGITWKYFDSEKGKDALLLLHGGYSDFDMWIHQIVEFEKDYRIIAPTCPILLNATMKVYSDALSTILRAENLLKVNMMGYSKGGLVA